MNRSFILFFLLSLCLPSYPLVYLCEDKEHNSACCLLHADTLIGSLFDLEEGSDTFLQNVNQLSPDYTAV
jgi:hypothetical protein